MQLLLGPKQPLSIIVIADWKLDKSVQSGHTAWKAGHKKEQHRYTMFTKLSIHIYLSDRVGKSFNVMLACKPFLKLSKLGAMDSTGPEAAHGNSTPNFYPIPFLQGSIL